ncbi:hypothetical protein CP533_4523, partial [Ophiocordyceps camponoti-saundersi (nom. inval.)]
DDATQQEIREDELYRAIERDFRPFDYTTAAYEKLTDGLSEEAQSTSAPNNKPHATVTNEANPAALEASQRQVASRGSSKKQGRSSRPASPAALQQNNYVSRPVARSNNRVASSSGGVQVTLDGSGSWSELARQDATLPADAGAGAGSSKHEGSGGMFGFLKSKRGRNHSPKPRERGVLGKEGARVVIS